jgi:outer membrane biosynthesis protein TonB
LIWNDEVMDDVVVQKPTQITIGSVGRPTFIVPDVGLPKNFAIVRPGNRGYLLTLGEHMRGTICLDGEQKDVAEFVRRGGEGEGPGGFRATPISGKDWGVVELDETGRYKLFFQFVPVDEGAHAQPFLTQKMLYAGAAGWVISGAGLAGMFKFQQGINLADSLANGFLLATAAIALGGLVRWLMVQDGESQASFAFSVMLHAALLVMTYQLYDGTNPFVWPGPRSLTGNYLVTRLDTEKPEPPKPTVATGAKNAGASAAKTPEKPKNTATKGAEGKAGGKGDTERARDPNAKDTPPAPPKVALMEDRNRKVLDQAIDPNLATDLGKFMRGDKRDGSLGYGKGTGTGVGEGLGGTGTTRGSSGKGTGGGGNVEGDFVSNRGKIDTGKNRPGGGTCAKPPCGTAPHEVKVALADPEGDFAGLTAEEINRVVKSRAGVFKACYQHELNRSPGIGGKVVIHFVIGGDGVVKSAKVAGGSTLRNDAVESCVSSNIMRLRFPAKGGQANVNYPFLFQPGG